MYNIHTEKSRNYFLKITEICLSFYKANAKKQSKTQKRYGNIYQEKLKKDSGGNAYGKIDRGI